MNRTPQQQAFITELSSGSSSIALLARAGSGKTTTMVDGAKEANLVGLAVAFNKMIAEELTKRMPSSMPCKTMNGLGHGAWGKHLGKRLSLNTEKIFQIAGKIIPGDEKRDFMGEWMRLVTLFRTLPVLPAGAPGASKLDDEEEIWLDLIDEYDLDFGKLRPSYVVEIARKILLESIKLAWAGEIDFADQLYMPVVYKSRFDVHPNVLVDEAQDLSPLQHAMISRCLGPSSRLIAVGDPHQAIYAWRGASSDSMSIMSKQFSCKEMPLTVSFRCSQAVIREAQKYVPDIEWGPNAKEGAVLPPERWSKREIERGDWIVCRNNRPLVVAFFNLAKKQIPAKIRGRAIGTNLAKLVDKIAEDRTLSCQDFIKPLIEYRRHWVSHYRDLGKDAKASDVLDRTEVLEVLAENLGSPALSTTEDLKRRIVSMFDDSGGSPVTLSTIHKAKGLEAKRVHFLDSTLIPSGWAKGDALKQEFNLAYVAITRAQETLSYLSSEPKE